MRKFLTALIVTACMAGCGDSSSPTSPEQIIDLPPELDRAPTSPDDSYPFTVSVDDGTCNAVHAGRAVLDAPAGKYGVVQADEDGFHFGDGRRIKFWGMNLVGDGAIPDDATGEIVADRLAKLGVNIVRFHWLDWSAIWNEAEDDLDDAQIAKLGRFLEQLEARGIYANMNLLTAWRMNHHPLIDDATWPQRSRYIIFWDTRAQELLKWYSSELLSRVEVNGIALGNHPMLAQVETINENVMSGGWSSGYYRLRPEDRNIQKYGMTDEQLTPLYESWHGFLRERYVDDEDLSNQWGGLEVGESLENNAIDLGDATIAFSHQWSLARLTDVQEFMLEVESGFYEGINSYLREQGVSCPITGSQFVGTGAPSLVARLSADYFNTHGYWNHHIDADEGKKIVPQRSMLEYADTVPFNTPVASSPVLRYARNRIGGRPFTISETNSAYPSPYGYELQPMLAAYASLQDWDGIDYFGFTHGQESSELDDVPRAPLTMSGNTMDQVMSPALSLMFWRGDFRPAEKVVRARHDLDTASKDTVKLLIGGKADAFHYGQTGSDLIPVWTPFVHKVERVFDPNAESAPTPELAEPGLFDSDTGELRLDKRTEGRELFTADSARSQIVLGRLAEYDRTKLSVLAVESEDDGAVILTSLDHAPLDQSEHALLVAVGDQRATDLQTSINEKGLLIDDWGAGPMKLRHMSVRIRLQSESLAEATVYALDPAGERLGIVPSSSDGGMLRFDIAGVDSPWFEIAAGATAGTGLLISGCP